MMTEITESNNPKKASKTSILNLFFQMLTNAQPRNPAPCLALCPFSLIFAYSKCSQNAQIKNLNFETEFFLQNSVSLTQVSPFFYGL